MPRKRSSSSCRSRGAGRGGSTRTGFGRRSREAARKRAEEATWPATTDCDRLDRVFETLETQGIILEQDAGLTKSDGIEDVTGAYEDAGGEESGIVGYCFYHGQGLDHAMKSGNLWLAFGDFLGNDQRRMEIGRCIQRAARSGVRRRVEWVGQGADLRERPLLATA